MTFNELITAVNAQLSGFATKVGQDITSGQSTGTVTFTKASGTWFNTPSLPASSITVSNVGAVNGGIAAVYYSGAVLTSASITGGTVVIFSGTNVLNELCVVYIIYDKTNDSYHVNIHAGATGEIPSGTTPAAPTSLTLTEGTTGTTTPAAPTSLTLTEGTI